MVVNPWLRTILIQNRVSVREFYYLFLSGVTLVATCKKIGARKNKGLQPGTILAGSGENNLPRTVPRLLFAGVVYLNLEGPAVE